MPLLQRLNLNDEALFKQFSADIFVALVAAALIFTVVRHFRSSTATDSLAKNQCKPIRNRFPHWPFAFGLEFIAQNVRAFRQNRFLELLRSRHSAHGNTFAARALARRGIFTIDPENIKTVLAGRFHDYCLGDRPPIMNQLLGRGIFVSDGEAWSHSRALLRPNFVRDQIADLATVNGHIEHLLQLIRSGAQADLQPLFLQFTLDSATEFLFGSSTNLLGTSSPADTAFAESFNVSLKDMALQFRMGPFRKLRRRDPRVAEAHRICRAYVDRFVASAVELRKMSAEAIEETSPDGKRNFFLRELAKSTDDTDKIRDEVLNILIAGRDTVASLLSSLFFVLARRPDIWDRVRAEVGLLNGKLPNYEQLRDLKYARNCINEVLRLYPPVPTNTRVAVRDTVLPRGGGSSGDEPIHVRSGTVIIYSVFAMHRRTELYGDDAEEFRPERWENRKFSWEYIPFNGGPRICLGQQYAITEASLVLVRFAQEFSAISAPDDREWKENLRLTLTPAGGVQCCLYR